MSFLPKVNQGSEDVVSSTSGETQNDKTLAAVKRARKQIESDAHLLANRIALLKQEELKAWKKIEETKKKAREVYLLKKQNEEKQSVKQNQVQSLNSKIKDTQTMSSEIRNQKKLERQAILEAIYHAKHKDMLDIKRQRQINEAKKWEFKQNTIKNNVVKSQIVKEEEAIRALKLKEYQEMRLRELKLQKEKELEREEARKRQKELEVMQLEKLEMELIQKLQQTQLLQKAAHEELETALTESVSAYKKKYFQKEMGSVVSAEEISRVNRTLPDDMDSNVNKSLEKVFHSEDKSRQNNSKENTTEKKEKLQKEGQNM